LIELDITRKKVFIFTTNFQICVALKYDHISHLPATGQN
jgi:hypothetical protein